MRVIASVALLWAASAAHGWAQDANGSLSASKRQWIEGGSDTLLRWMPVTRLNGQLITIDVSSARVDKGRVSAWFTTELDRGSIAQFPTARSLIVHEQFDCAAGTSAIGASGLFDAQFTELASDDDHFDRWQAIEIDTIQEDKLNFVCR
jgi:hypothetical protein